MTKRFAIINAGTVENIAIADDPMTDAWIDLTGLDPQPGPGWSYADGIFAAPPAPPVIAQPRHITRRAFRNRFTSAEKVAIEIAQLDDPAAPMPQRAQAAALRASQGDVQASTFIDLDLPDTRAGVQQLEVAGLLGAGRALAILDAVVADDERP